MGLVGIGIVSTFMLLDAIARRQTRVKRSEAEQRLVKIVKDVDGELDDGIVGADELEGAGHLEDCFDVGALGEVADGIIGGGVAADHLHLAHGVAPVGSRTQRGEQAGKLGAVGWRVDPEGRCSAR